MKTKYLYYCVAYSDEHKTQSTFFQTPEYIELEN